MTTEPPRVEYAPELLAFLQTCTRDDLAALPVHAMNSGQLAQVHQFIRDLNDAELIKIKKEIRS